MEKRVAAYIQKEGLLSRDGLHIVALSGGADSVALLLILHRLGYRIEAAHCNFHLRGEESNRDEAFVKSLCHEYRIPLHLIHFDTDIYASLHQVSIEMAARELRYRYFEQLCQDIGAETVCVAHHRDDAVETLLMNLLRGSGIHGLTGIRPKNGHIVRPLLCLSRHEVETFLQKTGQQYVNDSTNFVDDVVRNKVRLNVLPLLKAINPNASENLFKTACYLREAEQVVQEVVARQKAQLISKDPDTQSEKVAKDTLKELPSAAFFLHEWLAPYGFNAAQTTEILTRLEGESGRVFPTESHELVIDRDSLVLVPRQAPMKSLKIPEMGLYRYDDSHQFSFLISEEISISKSSSCATIDAALVKFPLVIRPTQTGDKFVPFGMTGHKLVSDFLTDLKLTVVAKRCQLVVTDCEGNILWVVGQRTDNRYRITSQTTSMLSIVLR